jgi:hypothetical protein
MPENIGVSIGADSSKLRADLAIAQAQVRAFGAELRKAASSSLSGGDVSGLQKMAAATQAAEQNVKRLRSTLNSGGSSPFGKTIKDMKMLGEGVEKGLTAITSMRGAFRELGETVGVAFAAEKIIEWTAAAAEGAETIKNLALATGISAQEFAQFSAAEKLVGGNAEAAARSMITLRQKMQQAVEQPDSGAMDAFGHLGLSVTEVKAGLTDLFPFMRRLIALYGEFSASQQHAADFAQLFGSRGLVQIARLSEGLDELIKKGTDLGMVPSPEMLDNLDKTAGKIHELGGAWEGFKNEVANSGVFTAPLENLTDLLQKLRGARSWLAAAPGQKQMSVADVAAFTGHAAVPDMAVVGAGKSAAYATLPPPIPDLPFSMRSGVRTDAGQETAIADIIAHAAATLPQGYRVEMTSGYRPQGSNSPVGKNSQHTLGLAGDFAIIGPNGQIPNEGADTTGMYGNLSTAAQAYQKSTYPQFSPYWRWGGQFGANGGPAGPGSPADLMHFDLRGYSASAPAAQPMPSDYTTGAAKKRYDADMEKRQSAAEEIHDQQALLAIAKERADFEKKTPDQQHTFLAQKYPYGSAENTAGAAGAKADTEVHKTEVAAQQYEIRTRLAQLDMQQDEARRRSDLATVAQIEQQKTAIIQANSSATAAEKIQAESRVRAAQLETAQQAFNLAEQGTAAQQHADADIEKGFAARQNALVTRGAITPQQGTSAQIAEVQQIAAAEQAALERLMAMADATSNLTERTRVYWQEWELGTQTQAKVLELQKQMTDEAKKLAEAYAQPFKQAMSSVSGSIESALTGVITRTTTLQKAWQDVDKAIISAGVHLAGSVLSKAAGGMLGGKPGEGIEDVLGNMASNWLGKQVSGLLPGLATSTAADTAGATASAPILSAGMVAGATAAAPILTAAMAAGGASSGIGSAAGGLLGASGGIGAMVDAIPLGFSQGGIVPSAAGGWALPSFAGAQPALLHSKEMVLPQHLSEGIQNMIGSGGGGGGQFNAHFHGPADAPSMERWFRDNMMRNSSVMERAVRSNRVRI